MHTSKRRRVGLLATAVAIGLASTAFAAAQAATADSPVLGEASVVLDFTTAGEVHISVHTRNASSIPAWGAARVTTPEGIEYSWGPSRYEPGEVRNYDVTESGRTCADLPDASAVAYGYAAASDTVPSWTTGIVTYPSPLVTVIGCDPTPTPTPTSTPTVQPTPLSPAPEATATPSGTPNPDTTPAAAAASGNSSADGALAATGAAVGWTVAATIAAAVAILAGIALRRRRRT
ncbi:hypothetical protein ACFVSU_15085 [Microbacterium sp. NPDC058062]|uniref:hypothetical protein n=1 Tax=Microbacterium sp. NPDC058062 TaxID=3346320 RepID=UPI0036DCD14D